MEGLDSLCNLCIYKKDVISDRGARFILCRLFKKKLDWPKYPRQPMLDCPYFEAVEGSVTK